jgi:hypothetical protein
LNIERFMIGLPKGEDFDADHNTVGFAKPEWY